MRWSPPISLLGLVLGLSSTSALAQSTPLPVPSTPLLVPSTPLLVPSTPLLVPSTPLLVPSTPLLVPSTPLLVPSTPLLVPSTPLLVPSTPLLVPSTPLLVPSTPLLVPSTPPSVPSTLLIEAESFADHGGFVLDTQFIDAMGSPYLLAHGLGRPVRAATTKIEVKQPGRYRVFVRTLDWVARWGAKGAPGRFRLHVGGQALPTEFGTVGRQWHWQSGGAISLPAGQVELRLEDLTGFDGRVDAIVLTRDQNFTPPNDLAVLPAWRRKLLGLPDRPEVRGGYDLVVVGGGYAGMGAAIAAARMGCRVALIQDRRVLGGNGSSEVRVWAKGLVRRGRYPRIGEIIEEFADHASKSPGRAEEFGDAKKKRVVQAEKNIDLFLGHRAYAAQVTAASGTQGKRIESVTAFETRTNARVVFRGRNFVDATGHGVLGFLSDAAHEMAAKGRLGMSNMWRWAEADAPREFPAVPWALPLTMRDFPYPRNHHGEWFWESGFDKDPLSGAESIRDWNLRAVFGAFNAMKNGDGAVKHRNAYLAWIAYIGGPRESRRLLGDVVLTQDHIVKKHDFPDGCVPSTWTIDLHYPKKRYAARFPDNPFIAVAMHDKRVDRNFGYPIPYRCFYSRDVDNLFMAGRCISVTHKALGTVRVMKTCGMMGEVVGKAASICTVEDCSPRDVYRRYLDRLKELLDLPGVARAVKLGGEVHVPANTPPAAPSGAEPVSKGRDIATLSGIVIDDESAVVAGRWTKGRGLAGYIGRSYRYASADSGATIRFPIRVDKSGKYEVRLLYLAHENRGERVPVAVVSQDPKAERRINMRKPPGKRGYVVLGSHQFAERKPAYVEIGTSASGGIVHADAVQLVPASR